MTSLIVIFHFQACAPRYIYYVFMNRRDPVGVCHIARNNFTEFRHYRPCVDEGLSSKNLILLRSQACAPRYVWFSRNLLRREPIGTCYTAKNNFADIFEYSPCKTSKWSHRFGPWIADELTPFHTRLTQGRLVLCYLSSPHLSTKVRQTFWHFSSCSTLPGPDLPPPNSSTVSS